MAKKIIQQGAEAVISLDNNTIVKKRIKKSYRISELDNKLRKSRTKSEAKIMNKLSGKIPIPKIISTDEMENLIMEYVPGKKLSEHLEKLDYKLISRLIGENIAKMHDLDIIHSDLTTSNMIYYDDKIYLIDFGLGFHSKKIEDKAVDLHLLRQALEAKHFTIADECFKIILDNYKPNKYKEIIERIKTIESRGRYKDKY